MNARRNPPGPNAGSRPPLRARVLLPLVFGVLISPAWSAGNSKNPDNLLFNATPSIPNHQNRPQSSAPATPSTTAGATSAASTAPAEATPAKPGAPASALPGVGPVPASLLTIEQTGKTIYQAAKANHLDQAQQQMQTLHTAYNRLAASLNQPGASRHLPSRAKGRAGATGQVAASINLLQKSLNARNRWAVMDYANQVVLAAANLSANFNAHVPVDAVLLGVYARELETWSMKRDMRKLPFTARILERTWHTFRPTVIAHHGANEAKAMDALVTRLRQAKTPADYGRLSQSLQNAAAHIEQLFGAHHNHSRPAARH